MNSSTVLEPPKAATQADDGDTTIWISVKITHPLMTAFFPAMNRIGTLMLERLLSARLEMAGIKAQAGRCGELNGCLLSFEVHDWKAALSVIKDELDACFLIKHVQVAYYDAAEGSDRVVVNPSG